MEHCGLTNKEKIFLSKQRSNAVKLAFVLSVLFGIGVVLSLIFYSRARNDCMQEIWWQRFLTFFFNAAWSIVHLQIVRKYLMIVQKLTSQE